MRYLGDKYRFSPRNTRRRASSSLTSMFITIAEAAEVLRCHRRNIERKLKSGDLSKYKDGRRTLIKRADLMAHIRKLRTK